MAPMRWLRAALLAGVATTAVGLSGCATPANSANMTVRAADATTLRASTPAALRGAIALSDVTGGKETNPMWVSNVSSSEFERALEESLRSVGLLAQNRVSGKYQLTVHLEQLDQPMLGFNMTVTAKVAYTLVDRASGKTAWEKTISSPYTASFSDAFAGFERLRLANEGAIRQNIAQLVEAIQSLRVDALTVR